MTFPTDNPFLPAWRRGPRAVAAGVDCSSPDPSEWTWITTDNQPPSDAAALDLPFGRKPVKPAARVATRE